MVEGSTTQVTELLLGFYPFAGGVIGLGAAVGWLVDRSILVRAFVGSGLTSALVFKVGVDVVDFAVNGNLDAVNTAGNVGGIILILAGMLVRASRNQRKGN